MVSDFFGIRKNLAKEFHVTGTQRAAFAPAAGPCQVETEQLPHGVKPQAARHYWVAVKVNFEEPQVRIDIQLCGQATFAVKPAFAPNVGDAVEHQHFINGQAHASALEQFTVTAVDQVLFAKRVG